MNRTGLFIAVAIAVVCAAVFAAFPQLDLTLARVFYNTASGRFALNPEGIAEYVRRGAMWLAWAFVGPAVVAPLLKLIWPDKPLLLPGRAVIFLLSTLVLAAIVLPNMVFKEHWGRARPIATTEFNGSHAFTPWWDTRGTNPHNGSFFSGEAATAFWTYAPAALAPPQYRALAFVAATCFGLTTGILRMAFGGHYATDVVAAGVTTFLVIWFVHGLIYRWKIARLSDGTIDRWLGEAGLRLRPAGWLLAAITALTIARLVALRFSVVDLFPDEARYWTWAQTPAFGYFSKPPLIAWIIAAANRICGNAESCVRAPAPVLYAGTAVICYFIARYLYGQRAGFWTGLCIALSTGVVYSARIISTDVGLLFFWAVALLAYVKLLNAPSAARWYLVLGVALGLGLLAKYAMIYFVGGMLGVSCFDAEARALWRRPGIWLALALALLLFTPNLVWNATHNFATFQHTRSNIIGGGAHFNPLGVLNFLASQFGVCGPIIFAVFLFAVVHFSRSLWQRNDRIMVAFALPPLLLVTLAGLFTSPKANWAAPSAISITIVAVAILVRRGRWAWLRVSVALGLLLQIGLATGDAFADRVSLGFLPNPDLYHRTMGWKALSSIVRQTAQVQGARSIAADHSDIVASLLYYLRGEQTPIFSWRSGTAPANQFDFDRPLPSPAPEPLLYLSDAFLPDRLARSFSKIETLPAIDVPTGPHSSRRFFCFVLSAERAPFGSSSKSGPH
jgi:membrane-associated phospholipid phosphatase